MNKLLDYLFPIGGVVLLLVTISGYVYLTAVPSFASDIELRILEDKTYFSKNQELYADCYTTVNDYGDFSIPTVNNRLYNEGVSAQKLEALEAQFKKKYKDQCNPVIAEYEQRYEQYKNRQAEAAEARLTKLDKILGNKAEIPKQPSPIFSLYQEFEPKSLRYPTNPDTKMLYSGQDYETFVTQNL